MATFLTAGFLYRIAGRTSIASTALLAAMALALLPAPRAEASTNKQAAGAAKSPGKSARHAKVSTPKKVKSATKMQRVVVVKNGKRAVVMRRVPVVVAAPPRPSFGQLAGLHATYDPLELKSSVAYVLDQDTNEILFQKNESAVLPIASLTKLMTGLIVSEAALDMNELIAITSDDVDTEKGSRSRLTVGAQLSRGELMLLALMSSENRAAHALGRTYPGGLTRFVLAMNAKAKLLGMNDTRYVEPTGLSSRNQSSAKDLATLTSYASNDKLLRDLSTAPGHQIDVGTKTLNYVNTNRLIHNPEWQIGLQKTGFISEAGHTLIMQVKVSGRRLVMVFLDSAGKLSRLGDAERVRRWVEGQTVLPQKVGFALEKLPG